MRVDLITGFLGAGKTSFLQKYILYLRSKGERFRIIENEFCAWGVDTKLLEHVHDDIQDLSGYCMCCTGKDAFISMLVQAAKDGCDRVLVEPSGIYDVDEFFQVMALPAVEARCSIGSIITIVDAGEPVSENEADAYLMLTQLLAAGCIIVSKTGLYSEEICRKALERIGGQLAPYLMKDHEPMIICRDWRSLEAADFAAIDASGFLHPAHKQQSFSHAALYGTCMVSAHCEGENDLRGRLKKLFCGRDLGEVLRVKGFVKDEANHQWYSVNCTPQDMQIEPSDIRRGLCVVIGQNLDESAIKKVLE